MRRKLRIPLGVVLLGGLMVAGCGDEAPTVKGRVTAKGKPVVWGSVTLVDTRGGYHQAVIDLSGNFEIPDVPPGAVKIGVVSDNPTGHGVARRGSVASRSPSGGRPTSEAQDPREAMGFRQDATQELPTPAAGAWFPIPDRYGDPIASGLTGEVKPGRESELHIELK